MDKVGHYYSNIHHLVPHCRLLVALSLTLVCTVVELAGFFSGLSMFTSLPNLFCIHHV